MNGEYDELRRRFLYYQDDPENMTTKMKIRSQCFNFAVTLTQMVPAGDALDIALERLDEVVMWAEVGLVRDGSSGEPF